MDSPSKRKEQEMVQEIIVERNMVRITGKIVSGFRQVHGRYGKGLYNVDVLTARNSGVTDRIPLIVPTRLVHMGDYTGYRISVNGQYRSYNRREEGRTRLMLSVFVRELRFLKGGSLLNVRIATRYFWMATSAGFPYIGRHPSEGRLQKYSLQ